jgi:hypothetical protein
MGHNKFLAEPVYVNPQKPSLKVIYGIKKYYPCTSSLSLML